MSENNMVYEIMKIMNDKPAIQNDMNEAMGLVQKMFEEKYIAKINGIINNHHEKIRSKPSREINLLQAYKAFMPESEHEKIDKFVNSLLMMEVLSSIRKEFSAAAATDEKRNGAEKSINTRLNGELNSVNTESITPVNNKKINSTEIMRVLPQPDKTQVSIAAADEDTSIHSDGVYDIDNQCMTTKDNSGLNFSFMPVFLLMSMKMQS